MSNDSTLHVICHKESGAKYKGLDDIDPKAFIFESRSWRIKKEDADLLIGGTFCLHSSKAKVSDYGGEILEINYRPQADNDGEVRAVVKFRATKEARGLSWPKTTNPMEIVGICIP